MNFTVLPTIHGASKKQDRVREQIGRVPRLTRQDPAVHIVGQGGKQIGNWQSKRNGDRTSALPHTDYTGIDRRAVRLLLRHCVCDVCAHLYQSVRAGNCGGEQQVTGSESEFIHLC